MSKFIMVGKDKYMNKNDIVMVSFGRANNGKEYIWIEFRGANADNDQFDWLAIDDENQIGRPINRETFIAFLNELNQ